MIAIDNYGRQHCDAPPAALAASAQASLRGLRIHGAEGEVMGDLLNPKPLAWLGQTATDEEEQRSIALFVDRSQEGSRQSMSGHSTPRGLSGTSCPQIGTSGAARRTSPATRYDDSDPTTLAEWQRLDRHTVRLDVWCVWLGVAAFVLFFWLAIALVITRLV